MLNMCQDDVGKVFITIGGWEAYIHHLDVNNIFLVIHGDYFKGIEFHNQKILRTRNAPIDTEGWTVVWHLPNGKARYTMAPHDIKYIKEYSIRYSPLKQHIADLILEK